MLKNNISLLARLKKFGPENILLLIAGQSNARGSTNDTVPTEAYLNQVIPSTFIWTGSAFAQLQINVNNDSSTDNHGVELNFGYLSSRQRAGKVYIVKVTEGGTGFRDNKWNQNDANYNTLVTDANAAIANLNSNNIPFHFAGLYWNQGEKDTGGTNDEAEAYETNLSNFVTALRGDITGASNMRFMFTRLATYYTTRTTASDALKARAVVVRGKQDNANSSISNSDLIDQDDLTHHGDEIHANSASQNLLASRVFDLVKAKTDGGAALLITALLDALEARSGNFENRTGTTTILESFANITV